ncbi:hypothetical protein T07_4818 [Trichinella nelsoni]|uniref:Uncharacterized protein n=1 Tax=Trichinella nelsoni TaxID=6336 RepID=A0A0V0SFH5_9BILA|nr:hypothetical protein T07_598 [Trichinella nelsoni]KRX25568.1 hypothetical protein T07_4818 [Trichinella nelsoni]
MLNPLIYIKNRWKQRTTNYKWGPVPERHTATLGDDVIDYVVLKADLKKMFIPLKLEMSLHAVLLSESATWRTSPKRFWDKLDIRDQDDIGLTY